MSYTFDRYMCKNELPLIGKTRVTLPGEKALMIGGFNTKLFKLLLCKIVMHMNVLIHSIIKCPLH